VAAAWPGWRRAGRRRRSASTPCSPRPGPRARGDGTGAGAGSARRGCRPRRTRRTTRRRAGRGGRERCGRGAATGGAWPAITPAVRASATMASRLGSRVARPCAWRRSAFRFRTTCAPTATTNGRASTLWTDIQAWRAAVGPSNPSWWFWIPLQARPIVVDARSSDQNARQWNGLFVPSVMGGMLPRRGDRADVGTLKKRCVPGEPPATAARASPRSSARAR